MIATVVINLESERIMETKTSLVRKFVASGEFKKALAICKDWRGGISKADSDAMRLGYECMVHPGFYQQLHYDTDKAVNEAVLVLQRLYS